MYIYTLLDYTTVATFTCRRIRLRYGRMLPQFFPSVSMQISFSSLLGWLANQPSVQQGAMHLIYGELGLYGDTRQRNLNGFCISHKLAGKHFSSLVRSEICMK